MAVAGLWESYRGPDDKIIRTYCVITIAANALIAPFHDRMPVVIEEKDLAVWLGEAPGDPETLLRQAAEDVLVSRPVRRR